MTKAKHVGGTVSAPLDLLNCESGSRCPTCHHYSAAGCALAAAVLAYETSLAPPPSRAPVALAWLDPRDAASA